MKKNIKYNVIGVMSGTSIDGIDCVLIKTNGTNYVKRIYGKTYSYSANYISIIKNFINLYTKNQNLSLEKIDKLVSNKFIKFINLFIDEFNIERNKLDFIGLSGQTILHSPSKRKTIQLGNCKYISDKLKINVVGDFRQKDILNGGQGAPIGSFYHKYILKKIHYKCAIINLGGISNITYTCKSQLISFDLGPSNSLIDDFIYKKLNKKFDKNGLIAKKGKTQNSIIKIFNNDKYFKKKYPKSLDRNYFHHYLNKIKHLTIEDAANTISMMTVWGIINGIKQLNKKIEVIILTGGGRKNSFFINKLQEISKLKIIDIDNLKLNGDLLEAEAFAYLSVRCIKKLFISTPKTTGVKKPISGGKIFKFN